MITDSKSLLAKLLASENITVEHRKSPTAYFDTKNRVMVLPMWKAMSPELYDLLLGHEVGHALYTPPQGWHDALVDNERKGFKSYLNVIEDTRIEKMIQEKFPGLKTSFRKGYNDLMEKDFFGVYSRNLSINALPLIDRINLHYKIGSYLNVQFAQNEQHFIDKIDAIKTWADVVAIAEELYEHAKEEMALRELDDLDDNWIVDEDGDPGEAEASEDELDGEGKEGKYSKEQDPSSMTDDYFRSKEREFIDDKVKPLIYVYKPTPNLEQIIVPYKRIKEYYNNFICMDYGIPHDDFDNTIRNAKEFLFKEFISNNKSYLSYLIKEFEMKRNAKQYARASISKTGELDIKKVFSYKIKDDIFKRVSVVPKGKNHGLVMFVDYSGSMTDNIIATVEQTILLAYFCRKVNIPFRVYAFTDLRTPTDIFKKEHNISGTNPYKGRKGYDLDYGYPEIEKFSKNEGDLSLDNKFFRLREYLTSEMSSSDFKEAVKYWMLVSVIMARRSWRSKDHDKYKDTIPQYIKNSDFEGLNGTPLNESIISAIDIVKAFKEKYRLDVVNTVFLTDGASNDNRDKYNDEGRAIPYAYRSDHYNLIIRDRKSMNEGKKTPKADTTIALLNLLKNETGVNTIGFFITPYYSRRTILSVADMCDATISNFDETYRKSKDRKFFMINDAGYDDYYIIPGGEDLQIRDEDFEDVVVESKSELKRAFLKMQRGKSVNRILLSRFINKIA